MSANKGFADHGECSRSIHLVQPAMATYHHLDNQFLHHLPPLPPQPGASLFNRRSAPPSLLGYLECGQQSDHQFQIISYALGMPELGKMTAQEIMDAKALAASKSHSEAERKRRERINNHLARLHSLLPSTTKTDKASLLAEVIRHLKELKRQTLLIEETIPIPTETDELSVDVSEDDNKGFTIRASLCCEDKPDLLLNLTNALKALRLRVLKAEITTIGGRVRNVLFMMEEEDRSCGDDYTKDPQQCCRYSASSIQEALKAVMGKGGGGAGDESSMGTVKKQRANTANSLACRPL